MYNGWGIRMPDFIQLHQKIKWIINSTPYPTCHTKKGNLNRNWSFYAGWPFRANVDTISHVWVLIKHRHGPNLPPSKSVVMDPKLSISINGTIFHYISGIVNETIEYKLFVDGYSKCTDIFSSLYFKMFEKVDAFWIAKLKLRTL